jgi:hypothetical protein
MRRRWVSFSSRYTAVKAARRRAARQSNRIARAMHQDV